MVVKRRKVPYSEVISYWLNYEYRDRPEFKEFVDSHFSREDLRVIDEHPDLSSEKENAKRYEMLHSYRNFIEWFDHAEWWDAVLDAKDISEMLVIHADHWYKLSGGTLKAQDIAKTMDAREKEIRNDPNVSQEIKKVYDDLENRVKKSSKIVVVGPEKGSDFTVIDGVHRVIRLCLYYLVRKKEDPKNISQEAYLGLTPDPIERSAEQWREVENFLQ